ncbi:WD40 repeat [Armatimonadetes bacterium DC]|nr:WD40 repeat [Armatimonadetes bacterium DC]
MSVKTVPEGHAPSIIWMAGRGSNLVKVAVSSDGSQIIGIGTGVFFWRASDLSLQRTVPIGTIPNSSRITLSLDGSRLGVVSSREVSVYDLRTEAQLCRYDDRSYCHAVDVSRNPPLAIRLEQRGLRTALVNAHTGQEMAELPDHLIESVCFSPDGRWLFVWEELSLIALDTSSDMFRARLVCERNYEPNLALCFSANSEWAICRGKYPSELVLWDLRRAQIRVLGGNYRFPTFPLAISNDGQLAAVCREWHSTDPVTILHTDSAQKVAEFSPRALFAQFRLQEARLGGVAFLPGGEALVGYANEALRSASAASYVFKYDLRSGKLDFVDGHSRPVRTIDIAPDGRQMLSCAFEEPMRRWQVAARRGEPVQSGDAASFPAAAEYLPDNRRYAAFYTNGTISLLTPDGREWKHLKPGILALNTGFDLSADGMWAATGGSYLRIWNCRTGRLHLDTARDRTLTKENPAHTLAFSPDGRYLVSGSAGLKEFQRAMSCVPRCEPTSPQITLWEVSSGKLVRRWGNHEGGVWSLAFSPDGKWLASGDGKGVIRLWKMPEAALAHTLSLPHPLCGYTSEPYPEAGPVLALAFSPDGKWLAIGTYRALLFWNTRTRTLNPIYTREVGRGVTAIRFAPDGRWFAYGREDGVIVVAQTPLE